MTQDSSFEKLYRKQCEEHEATYAKMNEFSKEATNLRSLLLDEQRAHERTKDIIRKMVNELGVCEKTLNIPGGGCPGKSV